MTKTTYTITVRGTGTDYQATVPEIGASVTGASFNEVVANAEQAVATAQLTAAHQKKRGRVKKTRT